MAQFIDKASAPSHRKATPGLRILPDKHRQWSASHLSGLAASQEADGPSGLAEQLLSQDISESLFSFPKTVQNGSLQSWTGLVALPPS